jgi:hypothetical protein
LALDFEMKRRNNVWQVGYMDRRFEGKGRLTIST